MEVSDLIKKSANVGVNLVDHFQWLDSLGLMWPNWDLDTDWLKGLNHKTRNVEIINHLPTARKSFWLETASLASSYNRID